jgi:hypothetical protein
LPAQGKSAACLSYRLWIRLDLAPHNGHSAATLGAETHKLRTLLQSPVISEPATASLAKRCHSEQRIFPFFRKLPA